MSSSRIFKADPAFTPVSLVSKEPATPPPSPPVAETQQNPADNNVPPQGEESAPQVSGQTPPLEETSQPTPTMPDIEAIRAEGYQQGLQEAEQAMQQKLSHTITAFSKACAEINNLHESLLEGSRGDMINLVMALSKKIIGRELATGRNIIVDTLQNAIELAIKHNEYDIWINPKDLATVENMVPELIRSVQKLEHVTLKTDPEITPGGCRLDSSVCTVDATIEAQLETARDFLDEKGPECSKTESRSDLNHDPDQESPPEEQ